MSNTGTCPSKLSAMVMEIACVTSLGSCANNLDPNLDLISAIKENCVKHEKFTERHELED
jgi:hypothetical protein